MLRADPPTFVPPEDLESTVPQDETVFAWYAAGLDPMFAELQRCDLDRPVFTWAGQRERRWWLRRLTHETAIHRFDVEQALTTPSDVDAAVAVDGIDEMFDVFVPECFDHETFAKENGADQTVHLHCTDVDGEWLVRFGTDAVHVVREHAKGVVAVRGRASDLELVLWNRLAPERCQILGDTSLFDRFLDAASF